MGNLIGIDLGTTMSAIAKLNEMGKPEIIPNSDGERIMPSAVLFSDYDNTIMVGVDAKNSFPSNLSMGAKEFKREMSDFHWYKEIAGKKYSAAALSSIILKKLAQDAEKENGKIKDVVISVPAYFKEMERNATIEAGKLAGLNVVNIINEPTAAALYYVQNNDVAGKIMIYDLGGGTFDVTILDVKENKVDILATEGDHRLGGVDFDNSLLELFAEKYREETGESLYATDEDKEELLLQVERAKKKLSKSESIRERVVGEGGRAIIEVTQEEFENKISLYLSRTELLLELVFADAGLKFSDIDEILLVGGSTRIPAISRTIEETVGKKPIDAVNVDEAVALGAAIKAGLIAKDDDDMYLSDRATETLEKLEVQEITNHSYGFVAKTICKETLEQVAKNFIIINKGTQIPFSKTDIFFTSIDRQSKLRVRITQGEDTELEYVDLIKDETIALNNLRAKGSKLEVTYSYDENGIMSCCVEGCGTKHHIEVEKEKITKNTSGLEDFLID